jgi:hypothetical protein
MVIGSSIAIGASVGQGGRNRPEDVRVVQRRLNDLLPLPRRRLPVSGRVDRATVSLIMEFQAVVLLMARPTGRVGPMDETLMAMNEATSARRWGTASSTARYVPQVDSDAPRQAIAAMRRAAGSDAGRISALDDFFSVSGTVDDLSTWLSGASALEYAGEFSVVLVQLRDLGLSSSAIREVMTDAVRIGLDDLMNLTRQAPDLLGRAARGLSTASRVLNAVGLLLSAYKVLAFLHQGPEGIGAAVGEIYATGMGMAIPWAGFVDGLQGMIGLIDPALQNAPTTRAVFSFVNAINPIGLGRAGVDGVITLIVAAVRCVSEGRCTSRELDAFTERMRSSPMRVFVEWGEGLGSVMAGQWGQAFYDRFLR